MVTKIDDSKPDLSVREKNLELANNISNAPLMEMTIVNIKRIEEINPGWEITYSN